MKNPAVGDERVLLAAPSGRDALLAQGALTEAAIESVICQSFPQFVAELRIGAGTAVIAVEALGEADIKMLADVLARQPAWSDIGLVFLTLPDIDSRSRRTLEELHWIPNATMLERPLSARTLVSSVNAMLRSRRRQYELRSHLLERERLERELEQEYRRQQRIAETLQRSLLGRSSGRLHPAVETHTVYRAASDEADVGGDFYDRFLIDPTHVALVVGDVSGKGLQAAAKTMEVKYPLRAFLRETASPSTALSRLNDFLIQSRTLDNVEDAGFICLFACILDAQTGALTFANAGIEPPLLQRSCGAVDELAGTAPPVGVEFDEVTGDQQRAVSPGDILIVTTDGITEARRDGVFFGKEGIVAAMRRQSATDLRKMVDGIVESAVDFAGGSLTDDACIVGARLIGD